MAANSNRKDKAERGSAILCMCTHGNQSTGMILVRVGITAARKAHAVPGIKWDNRRSKRLVISTKIKAKADTEKAATTSVAKDAFVVCFVGGNEDCAVVLTSSSLT